jgi:hypothetical protein
MRLVVLLTHHTEADLLYRSASFIWRTICLKQEMVAGKFFYLKEDAQAAKVYW